MPKLGWLRVRELKENSNEMTSLARRDRALVFCDNHIRRYERLKWRSGKGYYYLSIITILLSSSIPLILLTETNSNNNTFLELISQNSTLISATFSAIIAITTGILTLYQWRENYPRYAYTLQRLKNERAKFETSKIDDSKESDKRIDEFINSLDVIILGEVLEWRSLMSKYKNDDHPKQGNRQTNANGNDTTQQSNK